jgi:hypothetical protein
MLLLACKSTINLISMYITYLCMPLTTSRFTAGIVFIYLRGNSSESSSFLCFLNIRTHLIEPFENKCIEEVSREYLFSLSTTQLYCLLLYVLYAIYTFRYMDVEFLLAATEVETWTHWIKTRYFSYDNSEIIQNFSVYIPLVLRTIF